METTNPCADKAFSQYPVLTTRYVGPPILEKRFSVALVAPKGPVRQESFDDADKAMRRFVELSTPNFAALHGDGAWVALVDAQLQYDCARISEGKGTYRSIFPKDTAREAFERAVIANAEASTRPAKLAA